MKYASLLLLLFVSCSQKGSGDGSLSGANAGVSGLGQSSKNGDTPVFGASSGDQTGQSANSSKATGSTGTAGSLASGTGKTTSSQPTLDEIRKLFSFYGVSPVPAPFPEGIAPALACFEALVPSGGTGDGVCQSAGTTCTRVVGSSGNQTLYCATKTTSGDNASNPIWQARCCQDLTAVYNEAPTAGLECFEAGVGSGGNGDATCGAQGTTCVGVTGESGFQSLYCTTPTSMGNNAQNSSWNARCCRSTRSGGARQPTQCTNRRVAIGQTGDLVCASVSSRCTNVVGGSGYQSLYCGTDPVNGNNDANVGTWYARCCQ